MAIIMGCEFPEDRYYHPRYNIWLEHTGERVRLGLTAYAAALAGQFVDFVPRQPGQSIYRGRTCATLESLVWVGPVRTPVAGEVVAVNEAAMARPALINEDPYHEGWLLVLRPMEWGLDQQDLLQGEDAMAAWRERMQADGFVGPGD